MKKQLRLFDEITDIMKKTSKSKASQKRSIDIKLKNTLKRIITHQIRDNCESLFEIVILCEREIHAIQYLKR